MNANERAAESQVSAGNTRFQGAPPGVVPSRERLDRPAAANYALPRQGTLLAIAAEARANSERWFPTVHDPSQALVPLAVHYALGMCGEAGEVANVVKKALRKGEAASDDLAAELADTFIYLILLAGEAGVDLFAAYEAKRDVNEVRWGTTTKTDADPAGTGADVLIAEEGD